MKVEWLENPRCVREAAPSEPAWPAPSLQFVGEVDDDDIFDEDDLDDSDDDDFEDDLDDDLDDDDDDDFDDEDLEENDEL